MESAAILADKGHLIKRSVYEKRFSLKTNDKQCTFSFPLEVSIEGVKSPICIEIKGDIVERDYLLLSEFSVLHSSARIGKERRNAIRWTCRNHLFLSEEDFAPIVGENYILQGTHGVGSRYNRYKQARCLPIIDPSSLELILHDRSDRCDWLGNKGEGQRDVRYYYDRCTQKVFVYADLPSKERDWKIMDPASFFRKHQIKKNAIDQDGRFYNIIPCENPESMRLFYLLEDGRVLSSRFDQRPSHYVHMSYRELLAEMNRLGPVDPKFPPSIESYPFSAGSFTIHSAHVVGKIPSPFQKGDWVRTADETEGVVLENSSLVTSTLLLEGSYKEPVTIPTHSLTLCPRHKSTARRSLVKCRLVRKTGDFGFIYGYIREESNRYVKIAPLFKKGLEDPSLYLRYQLCIADRRTWDTYKNQAESIQGEPLDYVWITKTGVFDMEEQEAVRIEAYYQKALTDSEKAFLSLFNLLSISKALFPYILSRINPLSNCVPWHQLVQSLIEANKKDASLSSIDAAIERIQRKIRLKTPV